MVSVLVLTNLCQNFLFFFFKQKTAYEMRISDWSSDVCSSDRQRVERARHAAKKGKDAEADDRDHEPAHGAEPHREPAGERHRDRIGEIGRASCRERVCQYV